MIYIVFWKHNSLRIDNPLHVLQGITYYWATSVALGKGKVGDHRRPHLKIRPHPKFFLRPLLKDLNIFIYTKIKKADIFKISLVIIYFSNPSMYENNFWYLFDVKKQTLLNYDNLKWYYINLEGFLKPDNFLILIVLIYFQI